jgi:hypothetical protein
MNLSNKDGKPSAEREEERPLIEENILQPNTRRRARNACPKGWSVCEKQHGKIRK